ncbi:hypothetical protein HKCCE4037_17960 [Rhodobacterales bacterium HKCCE4037]|nr:hypothetical protein [Rhodobacterales bacterium HKCCE4037]
MSDAKKDDIGKATTKADDLTKNYVEKDKVGEKKTKDSSDDIAEGMPEKNEENLKDTTHTK